MNQVNQYQDTKDGGGGANHGRPEQPTAKEQAEVTVIRSAPILQLARSSKGEFVVIGLQGCRDVRVCS